MLPVTLKDAFGRVKTADQAYFLWTIHYEELVGYNLILSRPGDCQYGPKARMRFGKTGFLASLFCDDNLYFINNDIRDATTNDQDSQIAVNFDILFDSNAASYLPAAFEGSESESVKDFVEMLRYFKGNRINWNSGFYQIENAEAFLRGERLNDLFRVALASEKWTDMDMGWFNQTSQVRARLPDGAYIMKSNAYLAEWHRSLRSGALKQFMWQFELMYVLLLQMVILQLKQPSPRHAGRKIIAYIRTMHHDWHTIFLRMLVVAWELFKRPCGTFRFFKPVQAGTKDLIRKLRGMAWDLRHFQFLDQIQLMKTGRERFLIPYFLTFDRGLSELWELYPIRSCLIKDDGSYPICFPNRIIIEELESALPEKHGELGNYFSVEAALERQEFRPKGGQLPVDASELEKELLSLAR